MNAKKLLALTLSVIMVMSLMACGGQAEPTVAPTTAATEPAAAPTEAPVAAPASIDFEDGQFGFVALYDGKADADAATFEVVDYNGGKALKVTNGSGKVPYVAFDITSLLGAEAPNVASIEMTMGIENPDGEFYACAGKVITWTGADLVEREHDWSVYMEKKNPKTAVVTLDTAAGEVFASDVANVMIINLKTDNGASAGAANANLYIDDIRFLDASGNVLAADSSAAFVAPDGFGASKDMSNLAYLTTETVALEGMAGKASTAWAQDGTEMTEEFIAALVPGAIIEIEFSSTAGDMWIVMPDSAAGWMRVEQQTAATNNSKNICQITYEQMAAVLGEDVSTWGARLQCESSGDWEVYSVKVGQNSGLVHTAGKTALEGFSVTGDAWAQNGIDLTEDMIALLQPGCVIEIQYTSETGDMWIVMPDSAAGWMRVGQEDAARNGSICQITYEQIAALCGDDVSTWGARMQCEASGAWEVYSVSVCSSKFVSTTGNVALEGFACTGDAWAQNGIDLTEDMIALLVPGSVITIQYTSETGDMWIVMPDAAAGWSRVMQQTAACDGSVCQITYEQIAAVCGDDVSTWGARMQCEASGAWEVYSVSIGTAAN